MKGLVLGPIHKTQRDDVDGTNLEEIDPAFGSKEDFEGLLQTAKKKGGCLWGAPRGLGGGKGAASKGLAFWPGRQGRVCLLAPGCL